MAPYGLTGRHLQCRCLIKMNATVRCKSFQTTLSRVLGGALLMATSGVAAQVDPAAINQGSRTTLDYYRAEQLLENDESEATPEAPFVITAPESSTEGGMRASDGPLISVRRIVTNPSEILSESEIRSVLAPYENRELAMSQLIEAAEAIQRLYAARGRLAARAFVPAQEVADGVVQISLVEARLGEISISNNRSTDADYVRGYLSSQEGELVSVAQLERDLRRFNQLHDVNLRAALAPGSVFGTTNFELSVDEPARWQPMAFVDNAGREDVGLERIGLSVAVASLMGFRDRLALAVNFSEDLDQGTKGGSLSYDFPLNALGTRATLTYDRSNVVVIGGPIEVLNVRGTAWNAGLNVRHPFLVSPRLRIDAFAAYADKKSNTDFDDVELFSVATKTLSFGADFQWRHDRGASAMRHQITTDWTGIGGNGDFVRYNGDFTNTSVYAGNIATTVRARVQLGSEALLPSTEQFQIGGIATVRGYDEGLLIGDDGYFLSAEASMPINEENSRSRAFVFLDHGAAYAFKGNNEGRDRNDYLTSIGAGLNFSLTKSISGRLSVGFPLKSRTDVDGRDSPRLHFFIQSAPFL